MTVDRAQWLEERRRGIGNPAMRRFRRYVEIHAPGCWLWTGAKAKGYGSFYDGTRQVPAHRFLYERVKGPIADGLQLDHLCRVRACVNPSHLEPVTCRENLRRGEGPTGTNSRKTHCLHGHAFDQANTYIYRSNGRETRMCRTCLRDRRAALKAAGRLGARGGRGW